MSSRLLRDRSRENWTEGGERESPSYEAINAGSLQRIADATELMARSYVALIEERDRYKRWYEEERAVSARQRGRIRSLRGVITRLKPKAAKRPKRAASRKGVRND